MQSVQFKFHIKTKQKPIRDRSCMNRNQFHVCCVYACFSCHVDFTYSTVKCTVFTLYSYVIDVYCTCVSRIKKSIAVTALKYAELKSPTNMDLPF